jgi:Uncharacterised MFS-type transporter YbfB
VAGGASALVFMFAVGALLSHFPNAQHLVGWGFGGVGAGIALSGALVLITGSISTWSAAWWSSALAALLVSGIAWRLTPSERASAPKHDDIPPVARWFSALLLAYSLEGIGYIIAGTFLVAAIAQTSPGWAGTVSWILVGVCAVPSSAIWATLGHRRSRPSLLIAALILQGTGIGLPTVVAGIGPALVGAALFGSTFLGIGSLALALGAHLQFPRAIALLTTGYSVGQILGPQIVRPLLNNGSHAALLVGAVVVFTAALAAVALRVKFPRRVGAMIEQSRG